MSAPAPTFRPVGTTGPRPTSPRSRGGGWARRLDAAPRAEPHVVNASEGGCPAALTHCVVGHHVVLSRVGTRTPTRRSQPMMRSTLRKPTSKSMMTVFNPLFASPVAKAALVVVLPTPPLPEVTTITLVTFLPPLRLMKSIQHNKGLLTYCLVANLLNICATSAQYLHDMSKVSDTSVKGVRH